MENNPIAGQLLTECINAIEKQKPADIYPFYLYHFEIKDGYIFGRFVHVKGKSQELKLIPYASTQKNK